MMCNFTETARRSSSGMAWWMKALGGCRIWTGCPLFYGLSSTSADHPQSYLNASGTTWVTLVENSSTYTIGEDGTTRVEFGQPRGLTIMEVEMNHTD